jgi:hypothetical protein
MHPIRHMMSIVSSTSWKGAVNCKRSYVTILLLLKLDNIWPPPTKKNVARSRPLWFLRVRAGVYYSRTRAATFYRARIRSGIRGVVLARAGQGQRTTLPIHDDWGQAPGSQDNFVSAYTVGKYYGSKLFMLMLPMRETRASNATPFFRTATQLFETTFS